MGPIKFSHHKIDYWRSEEFPQIHEGDTPVKQMATNPHTNLHCTAIWDGSRPAGDLHYDLGAGPHCRCFYLLFYV